MNCWYTSFYSTKQYSLAKKEWGEKKWKLFTTSADGSSSVQFFVSIVPCVRCLWQTDEKIKIASYPWAVTQISEQFFVIFSTLIIQNNECSFFLQFMTFHNPYIVKLKFIFISIELVNFFSFIHVVATRFRFNLIFVRVVFASALRIEMFFWMKRTSGCVVRLLLLASYWVKYCEIVRISGINGNRPINLQIIWTEFAK